MDQITYRLKTGRLRLELIINGQLNFGEPFAANYLFDIDKKHPCEHQARVAKTFKSISPKKAETLKLKDDRVRGRGGARF